MTEQIEIAPDTHLVSTTEEDRLLAARLAMREYPQALLPVMHQEWRHLLFLHWEYDAAAIQKTLPEGLYVDTFQGKAYLGIVSFALQNLRFKYLPTLPWFGHFHELNLRTYVYDKNGTPGVWFYSLEANSWLNVKLARSFFYLPYFRAKLKQKINRYGLIRCQVERCNTHMPMEFIYKNAGRAVFAEPGTLQFFLAERYAMFVQAKSNQLKIGRIHHAPYPLYGAEVHKWNADLFCLNGFNKPDHQPDHALFSPGIDVELFRQQVLSFK